VSSAGFRNDGDNDPANDNDPDDHDGSNIDDDRDSYEDHMNPENGSYHDKDDASTIVAYGAPAGASRQRAVAAAVQRYYAIARSGDGARACAQIATGVAGSLAEDYGRAYGPPYLRGARSCAAVMSRMLAHERWRLAGPVTVTGVRIRGDHALALLGSTSVPAGAIALGREHGAWRIEGTLGGPLQ
jgi:hypothetical protein